MKKRKNKPSQAAEPGAEYGKENKGNRIHFFKSFEEMNEFDHRLYASLTPAEALSHVTLLRLTRYPYLNTNLNPWGDQVYKD